MSSNAVLHEVGRWKEVCFRPKEIPLNRFIEKIKDNDGTFSLKHPKHSVSRWQVHDTRSSSNLPAVFTHAFVWAWGTPYDTGNFVPHDKPIPEGLAEGRVKREPSWMCETSYAFDTSTDKSIYDAVKAISTWVSTMPNHNPSGKPKREWQTADDPSTGHRYIVSTKLFAKRTVFNQKLVSKIGYNIHPWIEQHVAPHNPAWIPNPDRAMLYDVTDGRVNPLSKSSPDTFRSGDIIKMTFTISTVVAKEYWWTEFVPLQLFRVGTIPDFTTNVSSAYDASDSEERHDLVVSGEAISWFPGHGGGGDTSLGKRKHEPETNDGDAEIKDREGKIRVERVKASEANHTADESEEDRNNNPNTQTKEFIDAVAKVPVAEDSNLTRDSVDDACDRVEQGADTDTPSAQPQESGATAPSAEKRTKRHGKTRRY